MTVALGILIVSFDDETGRLDTLAALDNIDLHVICDAIYPAFAAMAGMLGGRIRHASFVEIVVGVGRP